MPETPSNPNNDGWSRWYRLAEAAAILCTTAPALRARISRGGGGRDDFVLDGVRFRKFGRIWKVRLDSAWL